MGRSAVKFKFDECVEVFRQSITAALIENGERIRELNRLEPLQALSFDLLPWDPYAGLAFRLASESGRIDSPTNSADWKHSHFLTSGPCQPLTDAETYASTIYSAGDGELSRERAHLLFVAAAHALLDKSIPMALQEFQVDAEVVGDSFEYRSFKYFVMDDDATLTINYCDLVLANRATKRWLGKIV